MVVFLAFGFLFPRSYRQFKIAYNSLESKNQMLKIHPFNSLNFSDSLVSFSLKSESYKFLASMSILVIFQILAKAEGLRSNIQANTCNIVANIISCQQISPKKWEYFRNRLGQENCAIILPHDKCHILKRISGKNINLSINLLLFLKGVSHFGHNTERYLRS